MGWMDRTCGEMSDLMTKDVKWKDFPKWIKFKVNVMDFILDWLSVDAIKTGWKMPRLQFRSWLFYRKHPYLKRPK